MFKDYRSLWLELKNKSFNQYIEQDQMVTWREILDLMNRMEKEDELTSIANFPLMEEDKALVLKLLEVEDHVVQTCFDYIDHIYWDEQLEVYDVNIFIEPVGNISFRNQSLSFLLHYLIRLFSHQPQKMGYTEAGDYLLSYSENRTFYIENFPHVEQFWIQK